MKKRNVILLTSVSMLTAIGVTAGILCIPSSGYDTTIATEDEYILTIIDGTSEDKGNFVTDEDGKRYTVTNDGNKIQVSTRTLKYTPQGYAMQGLDKFVTATPIGGIKRIELKSTNMDALSINFGYNVGTDKAPVKKIVRAERKPEAKGDIYVYNIPTELPGASYFEIEAKQDAIVSSLKVAYGNGASCKDEAIPGYLNSDWKINYTPVTGSEDQTQEFYLNEYDTNDTRGEYYVCIDMPKKGEKFTITDGEEPFVYNDYSFFENDPKFEDYIAFDKASGEYTFKKDIPGDAQIYLREGKDYQNIQFEIDDTFVPPVVKMETIYFEDATWWNEANAVSYLYAYGNNETSVGFYGEPMTFVKKLGDVNIYSAEVDVNSKNRIKISRFDPNGQDGEGYWGAETDILPLADRGENNMYTIKGTEAAWKNDDKFATGTWKVYDPNAKPDPEPEPEPEPGENKKTIYFQDAAWWNTAEAESHIYAYKAGEGDTAKATCMDHVIWDPEIKANIWQYEIDLNTVDTIRFLRAKGTADWGAATVEIALADMGENDMYSIIDTTAAWKGNGDYVTGKWTTYVAPTPDPEPEPEPEPETPTENLTKIYFQDAPWWGKDEAGTNINAYTKIDTPNVELGTPMTRIYHDIITGCNIFEAEVDLTKVDTIRFTRSKDNADWGADTIDLVVAEMGENNMYSIKGTEEVWNGDNDGRVTGTWSVYTPTVDVDNVTLLSGTNVKSTEAKVRGNSMEYVINVHLHETQTFKIALTDDLTKIATNYDKNADPFKGDAPAFELVMSEGENPTPTGEVKVNKESNYTFYVSVSLHYNTFRVWAAYAAN